MHGSARLGRIFGIPLRIRWSAPVLILFLGVGLAGQTLPTWVPGRSAAAYGLAGLVGALLLAVSLLLHETAHAVTARRAGVRVDDMTVFALGGVTRMGRPPSPRSCNGCRHRTGSGTAERTAASSRSRRAAANAARAAVGSARASAARPADRAWPGLSDAESGSASV
ncbi:hypothetical protein ACWC9T_37220 [Kitasatospora sp. NPDC001159]